MSKYTYHWERLRFVKNLVTSFAFVLFRGVKDTIWITANCLPNTALLILSPNESPQRWYFLRNLSQILRLHVYHCSPPGLGRVSSITFLFTFYCQQHRSWRDQYLITMNVKPCNFQGGRTWSDFTILRFPGVTEENYVFVGPIFSTSVWSMHRIPWSHWVLQY